MIPVKLESILKLDPLEGVITTLPPVSGEDVNSVKLKFKVSKRRAGDIEASIASPRKAKQMLGWSSSYSLEDMCVSAFNFYKKHPNAINLKC